MGEIMNYEEKLELIRRLIPELDTEDIFDIKQLCEREIFRRIHRDLEAALDNLPE